MAEAKDHARKKRLFAEAEDLRAKGRHEEAIAIYRRLLDADPTNWAYRIFLCESLEATGRLGAAKSEMRLALLHCEGDPTKLMNHLGHILVDQGFYASAARCFHLTVQRDPVAHRLAMYGICLEELGFADEAVRAWERALELDPDDEEILIYLGLAFRKTNPVRARKYLRRALDAGSSDGNAWAALAEMAHDEERFEEELALAEQGLSRDPDSVRCAWSRGHALESLGRIAEAEEAFRHATEIGCDWWARNELAHFYWRQSDYVKAQSTFEAILRAWPDYEESYEEYAEFLDEALGEREQASALREKLDQLRKFRSPSQRDITGESDPAADGA